MINPSTLKLVTYLATSQEDKFNTGELSKEKVSGFQGPFWVKWMLMRTQIHGTINLYDGEDSIVTLDIKEDFEAGDIILL